MIVAIDGPAGVGKSSIASTVAKKFNFFNLNSGSFYRAITLKILEEKIDLTDHEKMINCAKSCQLEIKNDHLYLDGKDVDNLLHSDKIDSHSARISSLVPIRHFVNKCLSDIGQKIDLVAEGRDMTTVVFPKAEVKIFLDASPETRAKRRFNQGVSEQSYEDILNSIKIRDNIDRNKEEGSLKIADDALYLDTSDLTLDEVCAKVSGKIIELH